MVVADGRQCLVRLQRSVSQLRGTIAAHACAEHRLDRSLESEASASHEALKNPPPAVAVLLRNIVEYV